MSTALLFAGQGSQMNEMLHDLPEHFVIKETIEEASLVLGENVLAFDTESSLASTRAVQLSLLIYGVALARLLRYEGASADITAGHSVGAFAAAVTCKALRFEDALSVVELRGRLMEKAYPSGYGMGVIMGLDERRVNLLTETVNSADTPVFIANLNARDQITVAGSQEAIEQVFSLSRLTGAYSTKRIQISVPSHCSLLSSISDEITRKLNSVKLNDSTIPYVGNCRARVLKKASEIADDLSKGVANPVRWYDATVLMYERGVRLFVEIGPRETLANLAKKAFSDARSISVMSDSLESAVLLMKK